MSHLELVSIGTVKTTIAIPLSLREQRHSPEMNTDVPEPGHWPVDPQNDEPEVRPDRIWVDGCFDFAHHGR